MDGGLSGHLTRSTLRGDLRDVVLQTVPLDRPATLRPLYWRVLDGAQPRPAPEPDAAGGLVVPVDISVSFDTYFGAFFEHQWRRYTRLGGLTLQLNLGGEARIRIWRRVPHAPDTLLADVRSKGVCDINLPPAPAHFRQSGLIWFDLTAIEGSVRLASACWSGLDQAADDVGLNVAICTFNRETELAAVLERIADHPALDQPITRITVVNQGQPGLERKPALAGAVERLGSRLRIVEQGNFGGAGGFGRGLLEALDDDAATHVCFLDDDVSLEPDSLLRMASFFSLAKSDVALGGHMLDAIQPTRLYEAGAHVRDDWTLQPLSAGLDLCHPAALSALLDCPAMHYNGWWMFGFPKRLVEQVGMPLSCFIRGDDVEFGLRLHRHGVFTVSLPGVGIWHEPFYLKIGSWQLYYETRNALLCAALHQRFTPVRVAVTLVKRLLIQLLTYRYYNAALIVRAMSDFLIRPDFLTEDPRPIHASLDAVRAAYPQQWTPREAVLSRARVGRSPRWRIGFLLAMAWAVLRNWLEPMPAGAGAQIIDAGNLVWFRVTRADHLAVETHWDERLPTYRRDRRAFRTLFVEGLRLTWRVAVAAPTLREARLAAMPQTTSVAHWRRYLGLAA